MRALLALGLLAVVPAAEAQVREAVVALTRPPAEIVLADAAGTIVTTVPGRSPSWSPDGTRFVYVEPAGSGGVLRVARADGSESRAYTGGSMDSDPAWSPDGTRIAWRRTVSNADEIWVMFADGRGQTALASGGVLTAPVWSPRGDRLAWIRRGDYPQLVVAHAAGGELRSITPRGTSDAEPAWSPDGTRLAVVCNARLCIVGADGSNRRLVAEAGEFVSAPQWSPDGTRVAYTRQRQYPQHGSRYGPATREDVYVLPLGASATRLTGPLDDGYFGAFGGRRPRWWPDGSRLTFDGGDGSAWTMRSGGRCEHPLVRDPGGRPLVAPVWRPGAALPPAADCVDLRLLAVPSQYEVGKRQTISVDVRVENDGTQRAEAVTLTASAERGRVPGVIVGAIDAGAAVAATVQYTAGSRVGPVLIRFAATALAPDRGPRASEAAVGLDVLDCTYVGRAGADVLWGTPRADRLCGRLGADRITGGPGNDVLDGGPGYDTLEGGPGRDRLLGGGERDVILARDGERDTVDCGGMRDTAVVDRHDAVTRCERVLRR